MENLNYNLSEQEFTRSKKILLWGFSLLFFMTGLGVIFLNVVMHDETIHISVSSAPFGISIVVAIIASFATFSKKDHYFKIDNEKMEFKYGMLNPVKQSFLWNDIIEINFPHRQKKIKLIFRNNSFYIINLTWIEKKKSSHIRKHIFYGASEKNIKITKSQTLSAD
jgi:hypothetical protein